MAKASPGFYQFNAGELSPFLYGRIDLDKYQAGCARLENFVPRVQGPAAKRSGFRFVHEARLPTVSSTVASSFSGEASSAGAFGATPSEFAGKLASGTWRWAAKFPTAAVTGPALSISLTINVTSINTTAVAGFDLQAYGTNGSDDPQADSAATFFSRSGTSPGQYVNDTTVPSTTGVKTIDLGATAVSHFNACRALGLPFSLACSYANEAAAANTGHFIDGYTLASPPKLVVTWLEGSGAFPVRLIPFEFSTEQAYVLEFSAGVMRVYKDNGIVLESSKAISGTTNATPVVVTTGTHGYSDGNEVLIAGTGVSALDGKYWYVKVLTTTTFELVGSTAPGSTSATGTSSKVFELATPYTISGDVSRLAHAQSADTLYLAHPDYPPAKVTRTAHDAWSHTPIAFDFVPFAPENINESITVTPSSTTGSVTITANSSIFLPEHVGGYFKIRDIFESRHAPWAENTDFNPAGSNPYTDFISGGGAMAVNDRVHHERKVYALTNKNGRAATGKVPPTHETGTESDGSWSWNFINYGYGYALITGYTSGTSVSATVVKTLPKNTTSAAITYRWAFSAFSPARGYPKSVVFFEDKLYWASTDSDPDTMWASRTGRYEDHRITDEDDSAMLLTLNSATINTIEWLAANSVLQIGTSGGEWFSKEADDPLTPSNVSARFKQRSSYGSRESVAPVVVENVIIFPVRSGRKLRELTPPSSLDGVTNEAPDLTLLSDHLTTGKFAELAFAAEPSRVLWAVMENGDLLAMTYEKAQSVSGWSRMTLGGTNALAKSTASIPHPDGNQDQLWVIVSRTIQGTTKQYVEYLDPEWVPGSAIADAFFVDSGLTYSGSPATTISGLQHLEGQTVAVLADGFYVGTKVVSSGAITLSTAASKVHVGLAYSANLETLRVEAGAQDGTAQGDMKRILNVVLRIYQTGKGLFVAPSLADIDNGVRNSEVMLLGDFQGNQGIEIAAGNLYGGDTRPIPFPGNWEQKGQIALRHSTPLPCTISGIWPTLSSNDR